MSEKENLGKKIMKTQESVSTSYMPASKSDTYITPDRIWEMIEGKWGYKKDEFFDPCPVSCIWDALQINWEKLNFVNPPYSLLSKFVYKAIDEMTLAHYSIMLLPSKTDQPWFHNLLIRKYQIEWIRGRLKFEGEKHDSPQSHFLVMIR